MVELFIINVTYHLPQTRVSDIVTHVTLYTLNNVLQLKVWFYILLGFVPQLARLYPNPTQIFVAEFMGGRPWRPSPKLVARRN